MKEFLTQFNLKGLVLLIFTRIINDDAPPVPPKQVEEKEKDAFDELDLQTEKLSHPTANRARPPQRRPPSGLVVAVQVRDSGIFIFFTSSFDIMNTGACVWYWYQHLISIKPAHPYFCGFTSSQKTRKWNINMKIKVGCGE